MCIRGLYWILRVSLAGACVKRLSRCVRIAAHLKALDERVNDALIISQRCGAADAGRLGVGLYLHALSGLEWRHMHLSSCLSHLATPRMIKIARLCRGNLTDRDVQQPKALHKHSILPELSQCSSHHTVSGCDA